MQVLKNNAANVIQYQRIPYVGYYKDPRVYRWPVPPSFGEGGSNCEQQHEKRQLLPLHL